MCPRERGSWWEKAHSGDLVVRKRPLHRLLASSLLNCTTHHAPTQLVWGTHPVAPPMGLGLVALSASSSEAWGQY